MFARHAASLILWRPGPDGIEVLMGMRGAGHRFMPNRLVFPGGAVDQADRRAQAATEPDPGTLALLAPAPASAADSGDAQLTVVHGVRGLVADVRLDGELVLSGFAPERVTDPLPVPAGRHSLQVWPSGAIGVP